MTTAPMFTIDSLGSDADAAAFGDLNRAWISELFTLTDSDRRVLDDPRGTVVDAGGDVLIARYADGVAVGCVALLAYPDGVFELAKMAVHPDTQGGGLGRRLLAAAVDRARELGATRLFLGINTKLRPAVHLYEQAGFYPISLADAPVQDYYARADLLMELDLG